MRSIRRGCLSLFALLALVETVSTCAAQQVTYQISSTVSSINPAAPGFPASLIGVAVGAPVTAIISYDAASPSVPNGFGAPYSLATRYSLNGASISLVVGGVPFAMTGLMTAWVWNDDVIYGGNPSDAVIFTNLVGSPSTPQAQVGNLLLPASTFQSEALPTGNVTGPMVLQLSNGSNPAPWLQVNFQNLTLAPQSSVTIFGPGCSGALGVPGNVATSLPRLGQVMTTQFTNLPQNAAFFIFGWSNTTSTFGALPVDLTNFGAPGCFGRVSLDVTRLLLGVGGTATYNLSIPSHPSFLGAPFFTQCLALDPTANALGAVTSDAVAGVIGA